MEPGGRRGNAMMVAISLVSLLGFTALAVDLGMVVVAQGQVQVASDAVAHAAVSALDGTSDGLEAAVIAASAVAAQHQVLGASVSLDSSDVVTGRWDDADGWVDETDPSLVDAVRIQLDPTGVGTSFASVSFGVSSVSVATAATVRRPDRAGPARTTNCYLPIAVPICHVDGLAEGQYPDPVKIWMGTRTPFTPAEQQLADTLHAWLALIKDWDGGSFYHLYTEMWRDYLWPGGVPPSTVAWARLDQAPDDAWVADQVMVRCNDDILEVGDFLVANDQEMGTTLTTVGSVLNDLEATSPDPWYDALPVPARDWRGGNYWYESDIQEAEWANTLQGPVPLVDVADCEDPTWDDGSFEIVGFTWGAIYDVKSAVAPKNLWLQLDPVDEYGTWGEVDPDALGNLLGRGGPRFEVEP